MHSNTNIQEKPPLGLKVATVLVLLFLHLPAAVVFLYAFSTEGRTFTFPPPGLTLQWFEVASNRPDLWRALGLSLRVAGLATIIALILGTLAATVVYRAKFFGREAISFLVVLPIALPGIVTGIALRSALSLGDIPFSFWTIIIGHATFCVVTVYNNVIARYRRSSGTLVEASMDLGASSFETFRHVVLPQIGTALLAGGMLAFALSFDEVIVTTFTAGQQKTLPILILDELIRPTSGQRPVTNVIAIIVLAITFIPILLAHRLTTGDEG